MGELFISKILKESLLLQVILGIIKLQVKEEEFIFIVTQKSIMSVLLL